MPLFKNKSKNTMKQKMDLMSEEGSSPKSLAVAVGMQRLNKKKMAMGGEAMDSTMSKPKSIVEALMNKKKMAKGGEVDLQENSNEDLNLEDQLSFDAARKDTYYDLDQLDEQPRNSNEHGDDLSDEDEHNAGMIASIMRKMKAKRS